MAYGIFITVKFFTPVGKFRDLLLHFYLIADSLLACLIILFNLKKFQKGCVNESSLFKEK